MKKIVSVILLVTFMLLLVGCNKQQNEKPTGAPAPSIIINNQHYFGYRGMPIHELPEEYEYIGVLSEDAANGTGLEGCKIYATKQKDSFRDFYLYQECGSRIGINTIDGSKRQWAYVYWSLEEN